MKNLEAKGLLHGKLSAAQQYNCLSGTTDLKELVKGAIFIQECIPELLDMKQNLYKQLDQVIEDHTILSTFLPLLLSKDLKHQEKVSTVCYISTYKWVVYI